jgi:predicted transcriptional regulator
MTTYLIKLPDELKRAIKIMAAMQGQSMRAWIMEAIQEKIKRERHEEKTS